MENILNLALIKGSNLLPHRNRSYQYRILIPSREV